MHNKKIQISNASTAYNSFVLPKKSTNNLLDMSKSGSFEKIFNYKSPVHIDFEADLLEDINMSNLVVPIPIKNTKPIYIQIWDNLQNSEIKKNDQISAFETKNKLEQTINNNSDILDHILSNSISDDNKNFTEIQKSAMSQEKIESSHEQTVVDLVEKFLREKPIYQNEVDKLPKEMFTLLNC